MSGDPAREHGHAVCEPGHDDERAAIEAWPWGLNRQRASARRESPTTTPRPAVAMRRHKVTVIYESGAKVTTRCKGFEVAKSEGRGITGVKWLDARPEPLAVGLDHVVAVWSKKRWPW